MRRCRGRASALAVAAIAVGGCGSSSLSDRALRSDASRACTVTQTRTGRIKAPTSPAAGASFLRRGLAALGPELTELRSLHPPSDATGEYDTAVDALAQELQTIRAALSTLTAGADPVQGFPALQRRLAPLEARQNAAWEQLQIAACVQR